MLAHRCSMNTCIRFICTNVSQRRFQPKTHTHLHDLIPCRLPSSFLILFSIARLLCVSRLVLFSTSFLKQLLNAKICSLVFVTRTYLHISHQLRMIYVRPTYFLHHPHNQLNVPHLPQPFY